MLTVQFCKPKQMFQTIEGPRRVQQLGVFLFSLADGMLVCRTLFSPTTYIFSGCKHFVERDTAVVKVKHLPFTFVEHQCLKK